MSPGPFLRILVAYFCIPCSFPFPDRPPFPFVLLSRVVLGPSPIGIVSVCFWALSRYQKTVDSPQHRRGDGRETNRVYVLFTQGLFSPIPHHPFTRCIYAISFRRVLSRVFIERMRPFGDWGVVGGWRNLLYGMMKQKWRLLTMNVTSWGYMGKNAVFALFPSPPKKLGGLLSTEKSYSVLFQK